MRYLTKDWYIAMQRSHFHTCMKESSRAERFSEEFFQELYLQEENQRLEWMRKASEISPSSIAEKLRTSRPTTDVMGNPISQETSEAVSAFQSALKKALFNAPPLAFDPEKVRNDWRRQFEQRLAFLQKHLPEDIQRDVADMRVLALNVAAPDILDRIQALDEENERLVHRLFDARRKAHAEAFPNGEPAFEKKLDWHDEEVVATRMEDGDFLLVGDYAVYRFKDAEILEQDESLEGAICLYDEIYPAEDRYDIHLLLQKDDVEHLVYLTVRCRDVEVSLANPA